MERTDIGAGATDGDSAQPKLPSDPLALVDLALGDDPRLGLPAVKRLRSLIDQWEDDQVARGRDAGMNWAEIARLLDRHRQAVHREYAGRERDSAPSVT